jgi:hypothetical protein
MANGGGGGTEAGVSGLGIWCRPAVNEGRLAAGMARRLAGRAGLIERGHQNRARCDAAKSLPGVAVYRTCGHGRLALVVILDSSGDGFDTRCPVAVHLPSRCGSGRSRCRHHQR